MKLSSFSSRNLAVVLGQKLLSIRSALQILQPPPLDSPGCLPLCTLLHCTACAACQYQMLHDVTAAVMFYFTTRRMHPIASLFVLSSRSPIPASQSCDRRLQQLLLPLPCLPAPCGSPSPSASSNWQARWSAPLLWWRAEW